MKYIENDPKITRNGTAKKLKISSTRIKHYLDKLRQSGKIRHIGSTKPGHWKILD